MAGVLVLFAHPALERSRVNRRLVEAARAVDGVHVHDLYEAYPDFDIDVAAEQALLTRFDRIVFQHPLFWYSTPAVLKEWQDLVLEHGWAYGTGGTALRGKVAVSAVTSGGGSTAYQAVGLNRHTLREFLAPLAQTLRLCGVRWLGPFATQGTHGIGPAQIDTAAHDYQRLLEALRDDQLDCDAAERAATLDPHQLLRTPKDQG